MIARSRLRKLMLGLYITADGRFYVLRANATDPRNCDRHGRAKTWELDVVLRRNGIEDYGAREHDQELLELHGLHWPRTFPTRREALNALAVALHADQHGPPR